MSTVVVVDTDVVAMLLACWIVAAGFGLVGVIWMARQWRRRVFNRTGRI